jgi:hypothetical protein
MVVVTSATYGNEFTSTDVLKTIQDTLAKDGAVSIPVDSSIVPVKAKALGPDNTLNTDEQEEIRELAANMCGAADQVCLEKKTQELAQQKLKEKEAQAVSSTTVVKGDRLTVEYVDAKGVAQRAVIPAGQMFELGELKKEEPGKADPNFDYEAATSPYRELFSSWWVILGTFVGTFIYVSSIIITWMTFAKRNTKLVAATVTAIAVFIPYSGFFLSAMAGALPEYISIMQKTQAQAMAEASMTG